MTDSSTLADIRTFPQLIRYLRDELDWPISTTDFEDLTFDYTPEELGIDSRSAAKIQEIKRLRPLSVNQPWGVFFVKFEPKRLPVVALRRVLNSVVLKKRATGAHAERAAWDMDDLLFISNFGEGDQRQISFAHFSQGAGQEQLPTLNVLGWDNLDTALHIDHVAETLVEKLAWPDNESEVDNWRETWRSAFTLRHREVITTSRVLAVRMAELARAIRDRIRTVLAIETKDGRVTQLMKAFQEALVHDLDEDGFADMYAQTIAYGLLSARVTNPAVNSTDGFAAQLPVTNPFLKDLMDTFLQAGGRSGKSGRGLSIDFDELGVSDVVQLLDDANMEAVIRDFGDRNPQEDPVIHFYELFLKEYDAKKRMQRGVFYTPRPVVSYIVRSVHEILQTEFGLADGLADIATWGQVAGRHVGLTIPEGVTPGDRFVTILDPATGTGTFLVEAIEIIHRTLVEKWRRQGQDAGTILNLWNDYVPNQLLPRLHGYELLMAPYAIAHLKIGLKLHETGYRFESDQRARIYLTNALEPARDFSGRFEFAIPALAHEGRAVNLVKATQHFTVVIGNPPYSVSSANAGPWIVELSETYKTTVRTNERQIQALSDDYVKFMRLAHWHLERSGSGVLGLITNNGYLDGHLFVDMRASLRTTCLSIRILNLHGNLRTRERMPNGELDENVFDIQTGVSIALASKPPTSPEPRVRYADLWGLREKKYRMLLERDLASTSWHALELSQLSAPWLPMSHDVALEWNEMVSLLDVFGTGNRRSDAQVRYAAGFVSQQDDFAIAFTEQEIRARVETLLDPSTTERQLRHDYRLCTTSQWNFDRARIELTAADFEPLFTRCSYRPFDDRYTLFHRGVVSILRMALMRHLFRHANVALLATRGISRQVFAHAFVARGPIDRHALDSASESMFVFPLFLYPDAAQSSSDTLFEASGRVPNLAPGFLARLRATAPSDDPPKPEDCFGYVYAVLHSPEYRSRYAEPLSIDFPRIPIPRTPNLFRGLARLGGALVALHLMETPKVDELMTTYVGPRNPEIGRVVWADNSVWLDAPPMKTGQSARPGTVGFRGVTAEVWNFHIGGYRVCEKWLKDRKGRALTDDDVAHYQEIIVALNQTIQLMTEIDEVIEQNGGWPGAFAGGDAESSTVVYLNPDDRERLVKAADEPVTYGSEASHEDV